LDAATRGHDGGQIGYELEQVEVARNDCGVDSASFGLLDEGGDDVVGLETGHFVNRDAEGGDDLAHDRELVLKVIRHSAARRLVVRVELAAKGWRRDIEGGDDVVRLHVLEAAQNDAPEAEDGIYSWPLLVVRGV
jgi:hypothetical protein